MTSPIDDTKNTLDNTTSNNEQANDEAKVVINDPVPSSSQNTKDSYKGRKDEPKIDGPEQISQETDEIYADPRKEENLPAGGKNVGDLNAHNLGQKGNDI